MAVGSMWWIWWGKMPTYGLDSSLSLEEHWNQQYICIAFLSGNMQSLVHHIRRWVLLSINIDGITYYHVITSNQEIVTIFSVISEPFRNYLGKPVPLSEGLKTAISSITDFQLCAPTIRNCNEVPFSSLLSPSIEKQSTNAQRTSSSVKYYPTCSWKRRWCQKKRIVVQDAARNTRRYWPSSCRPGDELHTLAIITSEHCYLDLGLINWTILPGSTKDNVYGAQEDATCGMQPDSLTDIRSNIDCCEYT